ncbi:MAG: hypothetical protein DI536_00830 [Archangium gephyra]|uniref:Uncharacterized protein n=1 Tax=Archangium gephyra TaxID=48 RepID=A0A2W5VAH8_9BACT|nr:MAG: hypothetical protein DI536_00830 [Archangium gephyra]
MKLLLLPLVVLLFSPVTPPEVEATCEAPSAIGDEASKCKNKCNSKCEGAQNKSKCVAECRRACDK